METQQDTKRLIEDTAAFHINGNSRAAFETVLLSAHTDVIIVARNWLDPIFADTYASIFALFMQNKVKLTILFTKHNNSRSPEFLRSCMNSRFENKIEVLLIDKEMYTTFFYRSSKGVQEYPMVADHDKFHVRFLDTTDTLNPYWFSRTDLNDQNGVTSIRNRLNIVMQKENVRRY